MQKCDYKILRLSYLSGEWEWVDTGHLESRVDRLKEMGMDGWELVSVAALERAGSTYSCSYFFKRPLE